MPRSVISCRSSTPPRGPSRSVWKWTTRDWRCGRTCSWTWRSASYCRPRCPSRDAVLDSGLKKTVFVDCGDGYFEPRQVETGWRFDDRVQIVRGLEAGERIVTSANFFLDSETRMQQAAAKPEMVK